MATAPQDPREPGSPWFGPDDRIALRDFWQVYREHYLLESFVPRLIFMDLQLPGMDGFELTRRLKADARTRHIPIVAVTAYAMRGDKEKALAAGCDGYLSKPIDAPALPDLVRQYLDAAPEREPDGG